MSPETLLDMTIGVVPLRKKPCPVEGIQIRHGNLSEIVNWIKSYGGDAFFSVDQGIHVKMTDGTYSTGHFGGWVIRGVMGDFHPLTNEAKENYYEDRERIQYG